MRTIGVGFKVAISLLALASFSILLSNYSVYAEESSVSTATVTINQSCSMVGTTNTAHTANLANGTYSGSNYPNGIGQTTLKVFCNDNAGFAIYAIGYTGNEYGNTKLHNDTLGTANDISTGIYTSGTTANSTWSMKLASVSGLYAPTISDGTNNTENFTNWHTIPTEYTKVAYRTSTTDADNNGQGTGSSLTTTYDAYVSATQPAGTYIGQVKYTLVHPNMTDNSNKPVTPLTASDCPARNVCYAPNANDVEGSMSSLGAISGSPRAGKRYNYNTISIELIAPNYSRPGYGFAGWSTKWDATTATNPIIYGPNEILAIADLPTNEGITFSSQGLILYPVWIASTGNLQGADGQGWTGCSSLTQAPTNSRATLASMTALTDTRDNNVYAVARLADGKCWMVENLRLNAENSRGDANIAKAQGYGTSQTYGNFIGLADSEDVNFSSSTTTANSLYSSDGSTEINIGNYFMSYRMPRYNNKNINRSLTASYNDTGGQWFSYGNYYTWSAAIADTAYYNQNNSSVATTSICPKGWRLPQGGQAYAEGDTGGVNVTNSPNTYRDYYNLGYVLMGSVAYEIQANNGCSYYNNTLTNSAGDTAIKAFLKYPNNFVLSGQFGSGRSDSGRYWSSSIVDGSYVYTLFISTNGVVNPGTSNGHATFQGLSVRCIAQ